MQPFSATELAKAMLTIFLYSTPILSCQSPFYDLDNFLQGGNGAYQAEKQEPFCGEISPTRRSNGNHVALRTQTATGNSSMICGSMGPFMQSSSNHPSGALATASAKQKNSLAAWGGPSPKRAGESTTPL